MCSRLTLQSQDGGRAAPMLNRMGDGTCRTCQSRRPRSTGLVGRTPAAVSTDRPQLRRYPAHAEVVVRHPGRQRVRPRRSRRIRRSRRAHQVPRAGAANPHRGRAARRPADKSSGAFAACRQLRSQPLGGSDHHVTGRRPVGSSRTASRLPCGKLPKNAERPRGLSCRCTLNHRPGGGSAVVQTTS